jgi:Ca2+-binding RTX toxin-like protein
VFCFYCHTYYTPPSKQGDYFTGNFNYLKLVNDHDVANPTANSQFRHPKIYQADNIITGTNGDDTLIGINGKDILLGRGRNHVLFVAPSAK